uniref:Uncharacterized protein n=1 Tax=Romanomermis culicivorax TaxID=13658 RepID=A0A915I5S1_ROMCU
MTGGLIATLLEAAVAVATSSTGQRNRAYTAGVPDGRFRYDTGGKFIEYRQFRAVAGTVNIAGRPSSCQSSQQRSYRPAIDRRGCPSHQLCTERGPNGQCGWPQRRRAPRPTGQQLIAGLVLPTHAKRAIVVLGTWGDSVDENIGTKPAKPLIREC